MKNDNTGSRNETNATTLVIVMMDNSDDNNNANMTMTLGMAVL